MSTSDLFSDYATAYEHSLGRVTRFTVVESEERDKAQDQRLQEEAAMFMFAARVRQLRTRLEMTQEEFAETYHIPLENVEGWEAAKFGPLPDDLRLISLIERDPEAARGIVWG